MKLFGNKKTQPEAKNPKQDSSEIEKLKKQNKKLKDDIDYLESKIKDLDEKITDLRIEDKDRWDRVENNLKDHIDRNAPRWIEAHIDMAKIEDKVLLKVVKATFSNYKEEKEKE